MELEKCGHVVPHVYNPRNEANTEGSETNITLGYITNFRLACATWLKKSKMYLILLISSTN